MLRNMDGSGSYVLCRSAVKGNKWAGVIVSASDAIDATLQLCHSFASQRLTIMRSSRRPQDALESVS